MRAVDFEGANVVYAAIQPQYLPLPSLRDRGDADGRVTTCWELTDEELAEVSRTRRVWLQVLTFGSPLQPQRIVTTKPAHSGTSSSPATGATARDPRGTHTHKWRRR